MDLETGNDYKRAKVRVSAKIWYLGMQIGTENTAGALLQGSKNFG